MEAVPWHRFQFAFTITYHYLFPQLTMGLALLIVIFKVLAMKMKSSVYDETASFWARIFGINFAVGVVTGIPMEFQFGTNWARFADFSGGVIGMTLAMEGMFAFFAESAFLGLFLFGKKKLSEAAHLFAAVMVFVGSWLSGYFIIVTNAFMQHPVGYSVAADGRLQLHDVWAYLLNPWALVEYSHTMSAAAITGSFVVTAVGAYWALMKLYPDHARACLRVGVITGFIFCVLQSFPTGDQQGKLVAQYQKPALAAMEGKFRTGSHAELAIIGQPDMVQRKLQNPIMVPAVLSFLAYGSFGAIVEGLDAFPADELPDNIELVYYMYHIMVGLGTLFVLLTGTALYFLWRGTLHQQRLLLWMLMLAVPFPYIATTAGWMAAELGRQPWVIWKLLRTEHATSPMVHGGNVVFSALGFMGLYLVLGILFVFLVQREIVRGPAPHAAVDAAAQAT